MKAAGVKTGFVAADDGLELHWRAVGDGPTIVCCNGVGVGTFFWKYLIASFRDGYRVVTWDYRGHGRSERRIDAREMDLSISRHADDLRAICRATAQGPALLIGHSMGCQVILEATRREPEISAGLVLILGTAGRALQTFFDDARSPQFFRAAHWLIFGLGPVANELIHPFLQSPLSWAIAKKLHLVDPLYCPKDDMLTYMRHLATLDFRLFIETVLQMDAHDAWDFLPELDLPLLVIAGENDKFTPLWCSHRIAELTPDAEILVLADASHAALIEQPQTINHRLRRFISERMAGWSS